MHYDGIFSVYRDDEAREQQIIPLFPLMNTNIATTPLIPRKMVEIRNNSCIPSNYLRHRVACSITRIRESVNIRKQNITGTEREREGHGKLLQNLLFIKLALFRSVE